MGCNCGDKVRQERKAMSREPKIDFRHGLGDCANCAVLVAALVKRGIRVEVACDHDKEPVFDVAGAKIIPTGGRSHPWDHAPTMPPDHPDSWRENKAGHNIGRHPLTSVSDPRQLWEEMKALSLNLASSCHEARRQQIDEYIAGRPFVFIHPQGNTSAARKDLTHTVQRELIENLLAKTGHEIGVLDWDNRCTKPTSPRVHDVAKELGGLDLRSLAYLLDSRPDHLLISTDSGVGHFSKFTNVKNLQVWTDHEPSVFAIPRANTVHLVSQRFYYRTVQRRAEWQILEQEGNPIRAEFIADVAVKFISQEDGKQLYQKLTESRRPFTSLAYDSLYYEQHKTSGLDYMGHGGWQTNYGRWLTDCLDLKGKKLLDVGCACGSIAAGIGSAGVFVSGCDVNEHMIVMGRKQWLADTLKICDASNLHYWHDETFDCVHSNNVFEHLKPALVPHILDEIRRVTKPGGLLFVVLDTEEQYERQGRKLELEDITHVCVKPMGWWDERLEAGGWKHRPDLMEKLRKHGGSYFKQYDWPAFVVEKG